ncbi:extracellular proline-rich protein [Diplodia corticola]|uniref:Extracellular proline-rich protein n=1 Tax=Diplodia corticola TaxID=236234 RepID=A0A1J9R492_9PEZI|nr:extracellular proline-rich protein [Diplodia corticola]OJD35401.1 extracellular proline-rich protein [Diplodia corticola]
MHALSIAFTAFVGAAAASVNGPWQSHSSWGTAASSDVTTPTPSLSGSSALPSGTGSVKPSGTGGYGTTETATMTTFTTVTTCPVTSTKTDHGSTYITTSLTTSTITVTSCKAGCHHSTAAPNSTYVQPTDKPTTAPNGTYVPSGKPTTLPTDKPTTLPTGKITDKPTTAPTVKPTTSEYAPGTTPFVTTKIYPTTIIDTITSFVPCSTPVGHQGTSTWYSTWLTPTYIPHTTVSDCTTVTTLLPAPTGSNNGGGNSDVCPPAITVTLAPNGSPVPVPTVTAYVTVSIGHDGKPVTVSGPVVTQTGGSQTHEGGAASSSTGNQGPNPTSKPHWGSTTTTTEGSAGPTGTGSPSAGVGRKW